MNDEGSERRKAAKRTMPTSVTHHSQKTKQKGSEMEKNSKEENEKISKSDSENDNHDQSKTVGGRRADTSQHSAPTR